ncbi:alpha/beta hydrolase [Enterococcus sp. JM9B]|uniref:alpha/beta hydrolase n=1 Tax=Enterococcus sp. JM9B TaxID=1857216 RepID=UPI001374A1D9|nr:alpha/beta hydrolase [Enterococcus sp. JM9B]KAF1303126.1 hypothetical protein BAU16_05470 [Enterococcus sp. JM9B]
MKIEEINLNENRNVTLTAYIQKVDGEFFRIHQRPAVLILPGGGYQICSDTEADPVAMPYLTAGYQAFILRYSVEKNQQWPNPLEDYEQAMALIRERQVEWHVDSQKIAVIGFSAGGHLAGCAATMARHRPNAAVLGYSLLTEDVKKYSKDAPNVVAAVDQFTCPCFVFATRNDNVVSIKNSLDFLEILADKEIPFESHIYSFGPHGFSTGNSSIQVPKDISPRASNWVADSIDWLKEIFGDF